jgi:hypothetical protein
MMQGLSILPLIVGDMWYLRDYLDWTAPFAVWPKNLKAHTSKVQEKGTSPVCAHNIATNMVPWAEGANIIDAFDDEELISLSPEDDDDICSLCSSFLSDDDFDEDDDFDDDYGEDELQHTRKKLCIAFIAHGIIKNKGMKKKRKRKHHCHQDH